MTTLRAHPRSEPQHRLARIGRYVADLIVPPVCLACHARLDQRDTLCAGCWRGIGFIRHPLCDRLGLPLPFGGGDGPLISAAAAADPPVWARARSTAVYESGGVMAGLIHAMKYTDRHDARRLFGRWLAETGGELLAEADLIIPVPLARWRLVRRQFNQAAILAGEIAAVSGVAWNPHVLVKTRATTPQVRLSGAARRDNLKGAFAVPLGKRGEIADRRLVLVDDVITTGATMEACSKALLAAGAAHVDVLALARSATPASVTV